MTKLKYDEIGHDAQSHAQSFNILTCNKPFTMTNN